jgi:hypothetical protein
VEHDLFVQQNAGAKAPERLVQERNAVISTGVVE